MDHDTATSAAAASQSGVSFVDGAGSGSNFALRNRKERQTAGPEEETESDSRPPGLRRASSSRTESSFGESILLPNDEDEDETPHPELSLWYSLPLLIAVLPAVAGVAFKRGAILLTDFALLGLCAFFLHYCLVAPWIWYHSSQVIKVSGGPPLDTIIEEDDLPEEDRDASAKTNGVSGTGAARPKSNREIEREVAFGKLKQQEVLAFTACFLGPLVGAGILHWVRNSLSQIGDELVSNMHLTLFVLAAEIRPLRHLMKMAHARSVHLQRVVREDPFSTDPMDMSQIQDLGRRLNELESSTADRIAKGESGKLLTISEAEDSVKKSQAALQSQIDALNRAVRRYEKRATAQAIQTDARLRELDARLKDALSLAAAAANTAQRPGVVASSVDGMKSAMSAPLRLLSNVLLWPVRILSKFVVSALYQIGVVQRTPRRRPQTMKSSTARPGRERHAVTGQKL